MLPKTKVNKLKFGFPLGAWQKDIFELFKAAGYDIKFDEEFQKIEIDDPEIESIPTRPIPMASFIEKGFLDAGISTEASVLEAAAKVKQICNLEFLKPVPSKTKLVVAVPKDSEIQALKELDGKKIITRVPNIAKHFLKKNKISAKLVYSDALNEPLVGIAVDAIIDFARTGDYLKTYNLKVLETLLESSVVLIANENSLKDNWKKEKIEGLGYLLKGARLGQEMVGVMLHASNEMMEEVLQILPSLKKPTVTQLRAEHWFDVLTVANKKEIREIIPKLKKIGCQAIIEFPLNKVVL